MTWLIRCGVFIGVSLLSLEARAALVDFALLDIGTTDQRVEAGWTGIGLGTSANNVSGNLAAVPLTSLTGVNYTVAINNQNAAGAASGTIDWRDRGNTTSTQTLAQVGEDFVKSNTGHITVLLTGLPVGNYQITGYHLDSDNTQSGNIQMWITVGSGSAVLQGDTGNSNVGPTGINNLTTANIQNSSSSGSFTQLNASDGIRIYFNGANFAADTETPLNGLAIQFEAIPEPSSWLLASVGICGFAFARRRRLF